VNKAKIKLGPCEFRRADSLLLPKNFDILEEGFAAIALIAYDLGTFGSPLGLWEVAEHEETYRQLCEYLSIENFDANTPPRLWEKEEWVIVANDKLAYRIYQMDLTRSSDDHDAGFVAYVVVSHPKATAVFDPIIYIGKVE